MDRIFVRYYDSRRRLIEVSKNLAFNYHQELRELEKFTNFSGLRAEGDSENSQAHKFKRSSSSGATTMDYRKKLSNPQARLGLLHFAYTVAIVIHSS